MHIQRLLLEPISHDLIQSGKVVLLYGPRQSGKTTLAREIIGRLSLRTLSVNADQARYMDVLSSRDLTKLRGLVEGYQMLFIDEGQRVPDIGLNLKILHDELPQLKILVTGSSSFLLSDRVSESLAGRKKVYTLLPISIGELAATHNRFELDAMLEQRLVFGSYPEVVTSPGNEAKEEYLLDLSSSLLFKDILELEQIRHPTKIRDLLRLLAFQVGSQVSVHELCKNLALNRETVERYLYLLEQSFVIFRLPAYSRNPRSEISKSQKFYFYDNGIRNIVISNMKYLHERNDAGALWENFVIAERRKYLLQLRRETEAYFWRSYSGAEIDYVELRGQDLSAWEVKFGQGRQRVPPSWEEYYGVAVGLVNRETYYEFVM